MESVFAEIRLIAQAGRICTENALSGVVTGQQNVPFLTETLLEKERPTDTYSLCDDVNVRRKLIQALLL